MDKKKISSHVILYAVIMLALLLLFNALISAVGAVAENNLNITGRIIIDSSTYVFRHPVKYIGTAVSNKNLVFIIGNSFIILYSLAMCLKGLFKQKQTAWQSDANNTHGSAAWGEGSSITSGGGFILMPYKKFFSEWERTL